MKKVNLLIACMICGLCATAASPKVISHRGYWKADGSAQNSIRALIKADSVGCYGSEFDVWLTADDVLVVNHNSDINGKVIELGHSDELLQESLPNGEFLPRLTDFLDAAKPLSVELVLEVKPHKDQQREAVAVPKIIEMVKEKGLEERTTYITFSRNAYELLLAQTDCPVYFLTATSPEELKGMGGTGPDFHISHFRKNPDWVSKFKEQGMPINVWTVNSDEDMQYCIDQQVDFVTTDNPERALELITKSAER